MSSDSEFERFLQEVRMFLLYAKLCVLTVMYVLTSVTMWNVILLGNPLGKFHHASVRGVYYL